MSNLYRFLILIFACTIAACGLPAGTIGGSAIDELLAVPHRVVYDVNDLFIRSEDLTVFALSRGNLQLVPIQLVEIEIIDNPDWPSGNTHIVPPDEFFPFTEAGRKLVIIRYGALSETYSVEVRSGGGGNGGNGGNGGDDDDGPAINIVWTPFIIIYTQPALRLNIEAGDTDGTLSVEASVSNNRIILEDAELSFQWFSNNRNSNSVGDIDEISLTDNGTAQSPTFSVPTDIIGTFYYFVEVRATVGETETRPVRSRVAWVNVTAP